MNSRIKSPFLFRDLTLPNARRIARSRSFLETVPLVPNQSENFVQRGTFHPPSHTAQHMSYSTDSEENEIIKTARKNVQGAITQYKKALRNLMPGQLTPSVIEGLFIPLKSYGKDMKLSDISKIQSMTSSKSVSKLVVSVHDSETIDDVAMGLKRFNSLLHIKVIGNDIYALSPSSSKNQRLQYTKVAKEHAERSKQQVRRVRNTAVSKTKKLMKANGSSEDELADWLQEIQKIADYGNNSVAQLLKEKVESLKDN